MNQNTENGKDSDALRIWEKPPLEVFVENGLAGLKNRDGEVVIPARWGQVEVRGNLVAVRNSGREIRFWRGGQSGETISREDDHFYRNGKVGLLKDGKVWFDAVYDEIYDWSEAGFDVVYTRVGRTPRYFTADHRPVLTKWREFPDVDGEGAEEPYYVWEKQNSPVLVTMEKGGGPDDPQSCRLKDGFVRLDRMRKSEVLPLFAAASQIRKEDTRQLAEFDCAFTYIYSAYIARAKGPDAVAECFRDFAWMDCFKSSWMRLILVSVAPDRKEPLDVRTLIRGVEDIPDWVPLGHFAAGYDASLAEDKVKVFMVQYFADHWPTSGERAIDDARESYSLDAIREAQESWIREIENPENFTSAKGQAAFRLDASLPLEPAPVVPAGLSWNTIEEVCRTLLEKGATLQWFALGICSVQWPYMEESEVAAIAENQVRLLEWALAHGSPPNTVDYDETCLDLLEGKIAWWSASDKPEKYRERLALARQLRERIIAAGGKRREALLQDRTPVWMEISRGGGEP